MSLHHYYYFITLSRQRVMPAYLPLHPLLLLLLLPAFSPSSLLTKAGWVDPDSPHSVQRTHSLRDPNLPSLRLVMSDEFNVAARTFADGHDPTWTAGDHSDDARTSVGKGALIYYNHSYASTTEEVRGGDKSLAWGDWAVRGWPHVLVCLVQRNTLGRFHDFWRPATSWLKCRGSAPP